MLYRWLFALAVGLLPVYLWSSGGVQLSHACVAFAALIMYLSKGAKINQADIVLLALVLVAAFREGVAIIAGGQPSGILSALYILFSLVVFNSARNFATELDVQRLVVWALTAAVVVAVSGIVIKGYSFRTDSEGYRAIGTFNNPNQLGYFAVCVSSIAVLLYQSGAIRRSATLLFFLSAALFLSVASLSKAALLATAFSGLLVGFAITSSKWRFVVGLSVALVACAVGYYLYDSGALSGFKVVNRLATLGTQHDDSLSSRGYNVLAQASGWELFFGFGSLKTRELVGHEVHSTIFSFFANYGFVGGGAFVIFLALWARRLYRDLGWIGIMAVGGPPMLYGVTHNGSRFTIFWLLLALSFTTLPNPRSRFSLKERPVEGAAVRR